MSPAPSLVQPHSPSQAHNIWERVSHPLNLPRKRKPRSSSSHRKRNSSPLTSHHPIMKLNAVLLIGIALFT